MKKKLRAQRLTLEHLEERNCPSLVIHQTSSILLISGNSQSTTSPLTITGTAGTNSFQVVDGTHNLGTYQIGGSLLLNLTSESHDVDLNLNGGFIPGNVLINLGNGFVGSPANILNASVNVSSGTTAPVAGGTIRGSLTFLGGNGQETNINVGGFQATIPPSATPVTITPITVLGGVSAALRENASGFGNGLVIHAGTRVAGNVNTTYVDTLTLGDLTALFGAATISGSLSAVDAGAHHSMSVDLLGNVNGNVSINAAGSTSGFNEFTLDQQTPGTGGLIGKNLNVFLGTALNGNLFTLTAPTTVTGNATLTNGSTSAAPLNTIFALQGTINGSLGLNLGNGDNLVDSDTGVINGNLSITGGNGNDSITGSGGLAFAATVAGNMTVNLGNGDNVADLAIAPGGRLRWTSGNGNDSVALDPDNIAVPPGPSQTWSVNFHFGNGDDTMTLADAGNPQFITGLVNMGGRISANVFTQGVNWTPVGPFVLLNVP